mgnify:CR=1 FL=1
MVYLKSRPSEDQLNLLPVNSITEHVLNLKVPFITRWIDKIYWRLFHVSLQDKHIHKVYASQIQKIDYKQDSAIIYASTLPTDVTKRIEQINRNLEAVQTVNNPTTPA